MAKEFSIAEIAANVTGQLKRTFYRKTHLEINLVPDVKNEMIKAIKFRNFVFFLCLVVSAASVGITAIFGTIMGGQQAAINGKAGTIDKLSNKLTSYSDLNEYLTIKDQVDGISTLTDDKRVLSRTFNILSTLLPTGADTITISELSVSFEDDQPVFSFDAQANAGTEPYIDYAVLESFKKSMDQMRYDYGNYVDKDGNPIPAYCMIESGSDGAILREPTKGLSGQDTDSIYAYWTIEEDGCNPAATDDSDDSDDNNNNSNKNSTSDYDITDYNGQKVVKVWRTPQKSWYHTDSSSNTNRPTISLDGTISNVAHFESACTTYTGEPGSSTEDSNKVTWTKTNDTCLLVPGGSNDGITISESSNGRDSDGQLVLRFTASIALAPEAYEFNNFHMLAVPPTGRHNVTDSYVQVQSMFSQRATACEEGDTDCEENTTNVNGRN